MLKRISSEITISCNKMFPDSRAALHDHGHWPYTRGAATAPQCWASVHHSVWDSWRVQCLFTRLLPHMAYCISVTVQQELTLLCFSSKKPLQNCSVVLDGCVQYVFHWSWHDIREPMTDWWHIWIRVSPRTSRWSGSIVNSSSGFQGRGLTPSLSLLTLKCGKWLIFGEVKMTELS